MPIKPIAFCLALCPLLLAQSDQKPQADVPDNSVTKIIRMQSAPNRIVDLVRPGTNVNVHGDNTLKTIVVSGKAAEVAALEQVIRDLDTMSGAATRGKNVELMIYVLEGTMKPDEGGSPEPVAAALTPVYQQLRAIFPFKTYRLLSTSMMRSSPDMATHVEGSIRSLEAGSDPSVPGVYNISCEAISISAESSPIIHLDRIRFFATMPHLGPKAKDGTPEYQQSRVLIDTSVDLREGQKVVIGTSNVEPAGATVFLIVSVKVL